MESHLAHFNKKGYDDADKLWRSRCTGELAKESAMKFKKASFQVGSVHGERIDYRNGERVFHSSDMPAAVIAFKKAVNSSIRPKILDTPDNIPRPWDISVKADDKPIRTDLRGQLLKVRAGLMDQPVWQAKSAEKYSVDEFSSSLTREERDTIRHVVMVTGKGPIGKLTKQWMNAVDEKGASGHSANSDNDFVGSWNISSSTCQADDIKARVEAFVKDEKRRIKMNGDVNARVNHKTYRKPEEHVAEFQELVREKKRQYADIRDEFIKELRVEVDEVGFARHEITD
ncbi:hypothetical protein FOL47_006537 [Perkinsus chesapeaki]|uniref:Uncharacterized protein n=1 Tax=Perkinsus chesapeaki TaxID=330153 RepID=A0A7J6LRP9_PERCH|nr:hypothetical protein FOL47_006537 [Perkinsus chesapeaki]